MTTSEMSPDPAVAGHDAYGSFKPCMNPNLCTRMSLPPRPSRPPTAGLHTRGWALPCGCELLCWHLAARPCVEVAGSVWCKYHMTSHQTKCLALPCHCHPTTQTCRCRIGNVGRRPSANASASRWRRSAPPTHFFSRHYHLLTTRGRYTWLWSPARQARPTFGWRCWTKGHIGRRARARRSPSTCCQ